MIPRGAKANRIRTKAAAAEFRRQWIGGVPIKHIQEYFRWRTRASVYLAAERIAIKGLRSTSINLALCRAVKEQLNRDDRILATVGCRVRLAKLADGWGLPVNLVFERWATLWGVT